MDKLNVLITGAASGIGRATAEYMAKRGHRVFALDINGCDEYDGIRAFRASITDEAGLTAVRDTLMSEGITLDAILCIAGVHKMASLVESDYAQMKRLLDINLSGTMLTNRVFHSILAPRGRIVILTSEVAAYDPVPFNGLYNISKTALECYAQALRQELNLLGQTVVTVQPGAVETPLQGSSIDATEALAENTELYKKQASRFSCVVRKFMGKPIPPSKIAPVIYKAATAKRPRLTYSKHRSPGLVLLNLLPKRLQCFIIKLILK